MSTAIAILGGVGLFLLGMTVMTDGLKALAGSSLRTVLGKAAATPLSGAFWGGIITLLVQSSSAVTMTTIGLVNAGLLTFPQGLGLVFGANVGTTGTGWLVALIGVRVSLSAYALPLIFIGALTKLLAGGRIASAGSALAGFALVLYGLTTLQQGMGGLAESLNPSDLPAVIGMPGIGWAAGWGGLFILIIVGLAMTAVMQSSTAAIAVTIAAFYAGAVSLEQGTALIIGQNIGTATSSAMAAIGASVTAKRLALAYVLFKLIAAVIAILAFPLTVTLMARLTASADGTTLLAAYHTAYNVVGVAVLLPATQWFTRVVERILPSKETALERALDPSALSNPVIAVETARRVVADILGTTAASAASGGVPPGIAAAAATLEQVRDFLSDMNAPPETEAERHRMTSTLHALEHASRLIEILGEGESARTGPAASHDPRAAALCEQAMRATQTISASITAESALTVQAEPIGWAASAEVAAALAEAEKASTALDAMQRDHRAATLAAVAPGELTATEAFAQIDAARRIDRIVHHAWRSAAHLLGRASPRAGATA
ncbi:MULTISPECIES: Na/Pi symporter [unclassified Nitrobacter]|uniref:Na/Pi cotransporter family protein n=1 Tax=unclassified Nitrobacter TaxID=2620411 RepID=UPI00092BEC32|nr:MULTISPECIES: Na/Pi symporter [unclassified Nitrobacter]MBN9148156.1 Na/Pi cotransporter family protein [Nitrobacter sp.]OJV00445.1 MAG: sodium:proton antiporter [Nitrobacter sp. 62-23]